MELALSEIQARHLLQDTPFTADYGFRLHSLGDGECVLDIPFQEKFERPDGLINGGVYMSAADVAMWLAIMTRLGNKERTVTADLQSSFINSAAKEDVRCTANVLKVGQRVIYGTARCTDRKGKILTHHTLTYLRL